VGTSSGMIYIHELESVLSSIFLLRNSFSLLPLTNDQYHAFSTNQNQWLEIPIFCAPLP
jgi:hypothetical protein